LGAGAAVLLVHLLWRADTTLAGLSTEGFTLSIALFAVETFIAIALTLGAVADILPAAIEVKSQALRDIDLPTTDIFVVITDPRHAPKAAYSLAAAAQLDYPRDHVRLHLVGVDRATDKADALASLAEQMKTSWLAASPEATAGTAVNAVLARTAGQLVLILNAGEAPTPDLLRRIASGFVNNAGLAYCDVPVFAIDGDPVLTDINVGHRLPNDPGAFFKTCLKTIGGGTGPLGLNHRTVWRRAALAASGSCSRWNLRPDAPARIRAAAAGWRRGIVTRPMIAAIAPDTVRDYLRGRMGQRIGTIDAALAHDPLLSRGIPVRERIAWIPAMFGALMPFAWATAFAIPPLAVLLRIPIYNTQNPLAAAAISLGCTIVALAMAGSLNAGMRGRLIATWSETLESLLIAPSLLKIITRRTKTDRIPDPEHANGLLVIVFAVALAGTTAGIAAWFLKPELQNAIAPMLTLTIFTAALLACLLGAVAEPRQRRLSPRVAKRFAADLLIGGTKIEGRLADISVHGARFVANNAIDLPARAFAGQLTLETPQGPATLPVQLSRQIEAHGRSAFGLSFTGRTVGEFATIVRLAHRSGDAYADLCDARAKPAGLTRLFSSLSWRGLTSLWRKVNPPPAHATWIPLRRLSRTMH
jgi:cellulose synthase/poly-beta-1,6-N-acetylglucosamine synthase-like glycosyltransferase